MAVKAPPHSERSERALLGAILVAPERIEAVRAIVKPEDFYRPSLASIYRAALGLASALVPVDAVTLAETLEAYGELESAGGIPAIGALVDSLPKSANAEHYATVVAELSRRRRILAIAARMTETAANGYFDEAAADLKSAIEHEAPGRTLAADPLADITDPNAGAVSWLVRGLLPRDDVTLLAATWKTAKTLVSYALILDLLAGRAAWGSFAIDRPLRISIWQLEMPRREDLRRLRRLAVGSDDDPEAIARAAQDGRLALYSRPLLDFTNRDDLSVFHSTVRATKPDLVLVDSISAAFPSADLNDNPTVRRCISKAFLPIAAQGTSVLVLHHYRKPLQGATKDDPKARVLGAQQFGAAAGMVYGLERMDERDASGRNFKVILSRLGSWTPGEAQDHILSIEDIEHDQGTTVRVLDERAQLERGGLTRVQQAALNIKNRVQRIGSLPQGDAITGACGDLGIGKRTAEAGLAYARVRAWVNQEKAPGNATTGFVLTPGHSVSDPL